MTSGATTYANNFQYGAKGVLTAVSLGNGSVQTLAYNDRLQLSSVVLTKDSNVLQRYEYKYGRVNTDGTVDETKNNGQIGRIESFIGTQKQWQQRFQYDAIGRLTQASEHRGDDNQRSYLIAYDYDKFGNRYQSAADNPASTNPLLYAPVEDTHISKATNRYTSGISDDITIRSNRIVDSTIKRRASSMQCTNKER